MPPYHWIITCNPKFVKATFYLLLSPPILLFVLLVNFLAVKKLYEDLLGDILISDGVWLNDFVLNLEVLFSILLAAVQIDINWLLVL